MRPTALIGIAKTARDRPHPDGLFGPETSQSWGFPTDLKPQES